MQENITNNLLDLLMKMEYKKPFKVSKIKAKKEYIPNVLHIGQIKKTSTQKVLNSKMQSRCTAEEIRLKQVSKRLAAICKMYLDETKGNAPIRTGYINNIPVPKIYLKQNSKFRQILPSYRELANAKKQEQINKQIANTRIQRQEDIQKKLTKSLKYAKDNNMLSELQVLLQEVTQ